LNFKGTYRENGKPMGLSGVTMVTMKDEKYLRNKILMTIYGSCKNLELFQWIKNKKKI